MPSSTQKKISRFSLMLLVGTMLPMGMLALMYALAPLPMTLRAAATLHNATTMAAAIALGNWVLVSVIAVLNWRRATRASASSVAHSSTAS